jgi:hypothetical protein
VRRTVRRGRAGIVATVVLAFLLAGAGQAAAATVTKAPQGDWVGMFGGDGYALGGWNGGASDLTSLPGANITMVRGRRWLWADDAGTDVRALRSPDGTSRRAATWYDNGQLVLRLDFTRAFAGTLRVYAVDWSSTKRRQTVSLGGDSATLGDSFADGAWISTAVNAAAGQSVTITASRIAGDNAVISGIFLDATSVTQAPQGSWLDAFGADGYALAGWNGGASDLANLPGASVSLLQGRRWQWSANAGSDARALQSPDGSFRRAAAWYDNSQLRLRLSFTKAYTGLLHLYAIDWDVSTRRERVQVAGRTFTLDTSFNNGAWMHLPIDVAAGGSLTIVVDRLAGNNAVLSGIFLGERATLVTTNPGLSPSFSSDVSDYVVRCDGTNPVDVQVQSPPGSTSSIDGRAATGGTNTASVALNAGQSFDVVLTSQTDQRRYHVRCLPSDFPVYQFTSPRRATQQWYIVTPSLGGGRPYVVMFNADGVPVWWFKAAQPPIDAKLLPNGNMLWSFNTGGGFVASTANTYEERRLDGTLVRSIKAPGGVPTDDHDVQILPNGNILTLSYVERSTTVDLSQWNRPSNAHVIDALLQEQDTAGNLVWSWNSKDHFAIGESDRWLSGLAATSLPNGDQAYDIIHMNALVPVGNALYVSARHLDAIFKIDRPSGDIVWKLGGTATANNLTVLGDPESYPLGGQHDVQPLADGTVTVFDNATNLNRSPRGVRYRIDEAAKTATWVEQVRDTTLAPRSNCCGSARKLPGGGWAISWGGLPVFEELTADGSKVFDMTFSPSNAFGYRMAPVPSGVLTPQQLRDGMDAQFPRGGV